jgi:hypothetical protein
VPLTMGTRRKQLNLTPDDALWAVLMAQAEEIDIAPAALAKRVLNRALLDRHESPSGNEDTLAIGDALLELDRRLIALGRAQHNATIRLLVALGVPRAEVRAFAERHLQSPGVALPPTEAAHDGRPQEDGSDA